MITKDVLTGVYPSDTEQVAAAMAAIAEFEQSPAPGAWAFLDKATIIAEMRVRVQNPFQVDQGGQPFCGPAAVLVALLQKQPLRYVELCRSLFLLGGFQGFSRFIVSSDRLRQNSRDNLRMGQVDWMVLATLRDVESLLFPVEPNAPDIIRNLAGMTKSWEMTGWIKEILGYSQTDYNHVYLMNDVNAMQEAATVLQSGGVAFALITAEGMLGKQPPRVALPTHWISLLGNISVKGDPVTFDLYTWSQPLRLTMAARSFKKYLWATVTGMP
ncbi:MAG: hypothetical protein RBJ76_25350 [Stenomitos frigidus ULC029]